MGGQVGPGGNYGGGGGGGSVSGSGSVGTLAEFTGAESVGDSKLSESGTDLLVAASTHLRFDSVTSRVKFGTGVENAYGYTNGTGPRFYDDGGSSLLFNLQTLSGVRTITWPDRSATVGTTTGDLTDLRMARIDSSGNIVSSLVVAEGSESIDPVANGTIDLGTAALGFRRLFLDKTITAPATTGDQEINKAAGSVNFAALATTLVVTCNKCTENSLVFAVVATDDSTAVLKNVVPANGSFTIKLSPGATDETRVNFWVLN